MTLQTTARPLKQVNSHAEFPTHRTLASDGLAKDMPYKHKDLTSIPGTTLKAEEKPGKRHRLVVPPPPAGEADARGSLGLLSHLV